MVSFIGPAHVHMSPADITTAAEAYRQQLKANFKLKFGMWLVDSTMPHCVTLAAATVDDSNVGELSAVRSELQAWKTKFTAKEVEYSSMSRRVSCFTVFDLHLCTCSLKVHRHASATLRAS